MYAVIDIESTGGKRGQEKIIEIAVFRFDGREVVDQVISLVNSGGNIHPYVQKLTGITPAMLRRAPKFHELAKRIIHITEDAVLVGHNVAFDYRMLAQEFASLGYDFRRKTLDTIPVAQKLIPGLKSYGLENISRELNIYNPQRHRAAGDARVTLELFKILLEKDQQKDILSLAHPKLNGLKNHHAAGKLARLLDHVQPAAGLYYLRDAEGKIRKTGFAKNLFAELHHIFLTDDTLKDQIADIQTELTGNDLISKIKLHAESSNLPVQVVAEPLKPLPWQILWSDNRFKVQKCKTLHADSIIGFEKQHQAIDLLKKLLPHSSRLVSRNEAVLVIKKILFPQPDFLIKTPGRTLDETAVIAVLDYTVVGYGYYRLNYEIQKFQAFRKTLTPIVECAQILGIVRSWLQKHPDSLMPLPKQNTDADDNPSTPPGTADEVVISGD